MRSAPAAVLCLATLIGPARAAQETVLADFEAEAWTNMAVDTAPAASGEASGRWDAARSFAAVRAAAERWDGWRLDGRYVKLLADIGLDNGRDALDGAEAAARRTVISRKRGANARYVHSYDYVQPPALKLYQYNGAGELIGWEYLVTRLGRARDRRDIDARFTATEGAASALPVLGTKGIGTLWVTPLTVEAVEGEQ